MEPSESKKSKISEEISERVTGYILTALSLIVGLAWNDAIISLINFLLPFNKNTVIAKLIYAAALTLVVVMLMRYFFKKPSK
jgi:hypothetical protein